METAAPAEAATTKTTKSTTRTRKVGGLRAFFIDPDRQSLGLLPVENWPDQGPTTRQGAKEQYLKLELEGKIFLMRDAGTLEGVPKTTLRFK